MTSDSNQLDGLHPAANGDSEHPIAEPLPAATRRTVPPDPRAKNGIRHGLTAGSLPKGCGYVKKICGAYRSALEAAVLAARGEITLYDASIIQTALRHERHALLAQRWLRIGEDKLSPDQRLAHSRDIGKASAERDKCLRELRIDHVNLPPADSDPWATIDTQAASSTVERSGAASSTSSNESEAVE